MYLLAEPLWYAGLEPVLADEFRFFIAQEL
jgi:hypothetical protein